MVLDRKRSEWQKAFALLLKVPLVACRWRIAALLGLLTISQIAGVCSALALRAIVNELTEPGTISATGPVLILGLTMILSSAGLVGWWISVVRQSIIERTELAVDTYICQWSGGAVGIEHFENPRFADQLEIIRQERQGFASLPETLSQVFAISARMILVVILLLRIHPILAVIPVLAAPSMLVSINWQRRLQGIMDEVAPSWRLQAQLFALGGTESAGRELRVFNAKLFLQKRLGLALVEGNRPLANGLAAGAVRQSLASAVFGLGFALGLFVLSRQVMMGAATPGDVALMLTIGGQLNSQLGNLAGTLAWVPRQLATGVRLLRLREYAGDVDASTDGKWTEPPARLRSGIRLTNVSFAYEGSKRLALDNVNLFLPAGSVVALVAENGGGKTTLVKLLSLLYEPTEGSITVDNVPLGNICPDGWRLVLSAGFQDFVRFEFPAQWAIGCGYLPRLDDTSAVLSALERADSTEVLSSLERGLKTQLGRRFDGGTELSGGEWQKIALGRAMMRKQPILFLLDEPTAALDPLTEARLFERYATVAAEVAMAVGGITVLVSHRFSTVRMADLIIVMDEGRVVETGSHLELMTAGRLYASLYRLQAKGYH